MIGRRHLTVAALSALCVAARPAWARSRPFSGEAFEAARFAIDALKASAPIWKREEWRDGSDWGTGASAPVDPREVSR